MTLWGEFVTLFLLFAKEKPATFAANSKNPISMKKVLFLLFATLLSIVPILAEEEIPIGKDGQTSPSGGGDGGRTAVLAPTASLGASALSIAYPLDAVSVVQIVDEATDAVVYSGSFGATRLVVIDLEEEGLTAGNYRLRIFVFGEWWSGEFEIE